MKHESLSLLPQEKISLHDALRAGTLEAKDKNFYFEDNENNQIHYCHSIAQISEYFEEVLKNTQRDFPALQELFYYGMIKSLNRMGQLSDTDKIKAQHVLFAADNTYDTNVQKTLRIFLQELKKEEVKEFAVNEYITIMNEQRLSFGNLSLQEIKERADQENSCYTM